MACWFRLAGSGGPPILGGQLAGLADAGQDATRDFLTSQVLQVFTLRGKLPGAVRQGEHGLLVNDGGGAGTDVTARFGRSHPGGLQFDAAANCFDAGPGDLVYQCIHLSSAA